MRDRRRNLVLGGAGFSPSQVGASHWLLNSTESGDVTQWNSQFDSAHGTANAARAPTGLTGAGLDFDTNDCVNLPIQASTFNTTYLGYYFWCKPDAVATSQTLISISIGTGGASARVMVLMFSSAALICDVFVSGTAGRRATVTSQAAAGVSRLWGFEYNNDKVGEGNKLTLTRDGAVLSPSFSDVGVGGTLGSLVSATGDILIGNFNDGVTSNPLNGVIGRSLIAFNAPMSGATTGLLTTTARTQLLNFLPLT